MSHPLLPFSRLIWISATSFHLRALSFPLWMSEPYVANTLTSVFKANGILFPLYVDPLKLIIFVCNRSAFLTAPQKNVVISVQKEQCVSSSSCSVLQIGPSSRQHDMISQCSLSAYTQLVLHAQLWCQSLCGKPWCMEWGACWAVWVCCCHDNHPLEVCCAKKKKKKK